MMIEQVLNDIEGGAVVPPFRHRPAVVPKNGGRDDVEVQFKLPSSRETGCVVPQSAHGEVARRP